MPLVSVIMPAYNMAQYIAKSIESVLCQDYGDWELIIVDDGSIDNTGSICRKYMAIDARIKYYYKPNGGLPSARNFAIEHANGDLLALLDSDDLWLLEKLNISVSEFEKDNQDLLFTSFYKFQDDSDIDNLQKLQLFEVDNTVYSGDIGIKSFILGNRIHVPTVMVKKKIIVEIGGFPNLNFAEDYAMWLELLLNNYKFRSINIPLSLYRESSNSMYHSAKNIIFLLFKAIQYNIHKYPKILKHKKELMTFIDYYLSIDYNKDKKDEFLYMLDEFGIKSSLINFILINNYPLSNMAEKLFLRIALKCNKVVV